MHLPPRSPHQDRQQRLPSPTTCNIDKYVSQKTRLTSYDLLHSRADVREHRKHVFTYRHLLWKPRSHLFCRPATSCSITGNTSECAHELFDGVRRKLR